MTLLLDRLTDCNPLPIEKNPDLPIQRKTSFSLDPSQRPEDLNKKISEAFKKITKCEKSNWGVYNGQENYALCNLDEYQLLKHIIVSSKDQKVFYALDIGAGDFNWGRGLEQYLNEQQDLPKDIQVNILGVRGEKAFFPEIEEIGICKIYKLGTFKIEEISWEFEKRDLHFESKLDLIVSRWCFRHLVDPVGTLIQTMNLLRPLSGRLLMDGFFFTENNESLNDIRVFSTANLHMMQLFEDMKARFLMRNFRVLRSLNHFVVERTDPTDCHLPLRYKGFIVNTRKLQINSGIITCFERDPDKKKTLFDTYMKGYSFCSAHYGSKKLFNELKKTDLFVQQATRWIPLKECDLYLKTPSLHKAIVNGNLEEVKKWLESGSDIDESDEKGNSALHLSIQMQNWELFNFLLSLKPQTELSNYQRHAPIHECAIYDKEGYYLKKLILAGVNINLVIDEGFYTDETPLDCAIMDENIEAVKILLENGAGISKENSADLKEDSFKELFDLIKEKIEEVNKKIYRIEKPKIRCLINDDFSRRGLDRIVSKEENQPFFRSDP